MPDKKLPDSEIVKAWNEEIHLANYVNENYRNCIKVSLIENTLDLINCQKAEIEGLNKDLTRACAERDARIVTQNFIKAEAIKEFAERLKEKAYTECDITGYKYQVVQIEEIDNLLKELMGDNDASE